MSKIQIEVDENDIVPGYNPSKVTYKFLDATEGYRLLPEKFYGISWLRVGYHCPVCSGWHGVMADRRAEYGQVRTLRTKATDAELKFIAAHKNIRILTRGELDQLRKIKHHSDHRIDHKLYFGRKIADGSYRWGSDELGTHYLFNEAGPYYTTLTPAELQDMLKRWGEIVEPKTYRKMTPIEVIACLYARELSVANKEKDLFGSNKAEFIFRDVGGDSMADFSADANYYYTTLTPEKLLKKLGYLYPA